MYIKWEKYGKTGFIVITGRRGFISGYLARRDYIIKEAYTGGPYNLCIYPIHPPR